MGERRPCKAEVVGSNPICSTNRVDPRGPASGWTARLYVALSKVL